MFRLSTLRTVASALNVAPWKLALAGAVVLSGTVAIAIVAAGLFLLVLPVVVVAVGIAALLAPRRRPDVPAPVRTQPQVIDVEFEVIEQPREKR
jgi:uncharacterized membrane protein